MDNMKEGDDLRGDEHGGRSNELELAAEDGHVGEEPVDERHGEEERLVVDLVLLRHFNEPVNEDGSHTRSDVRLFLHVVRLGPVPFLRSFTVH